MWFLWKARSNPLFLLGIPVLMVMGGSVFFENATPFWKPGRFDAVVLLMAWLDDRWAVTVARRSRLGDAPIGPFGAGRVLPEELPLIGIAILIGAHTVGAFAQSGDLGMAVSQRQAPSSSCSATFSSGASPAVRHELRRSSSWEQS